MYPDHDRHHSSVPVSSWHLSVIFCHQCRAWRLMHYGARQDDDLVMRSRGSVVIDFGPFADLQDVLEAARASVVADALPPFGSWLQAGDATTSSSSPLPSNDSEQHSLW